MTDNNLMPALFIGHGNPMNAIEDNEFVRGFRQVASELPVPKVILCISAHWETQGTSLTAMNQPRTIHDFYGFPAPLYQVQYPAPGSPELAKSIKEQLTEYNLILDSERGFDHGAWSVLKHFYPEANIPVVQMSLNVRMTPKEHYQLAKELNYLRKNGVLIIGSGNIVHNLRMVAWDKYDVDGYAYEWATEANDKMKELILAGDHQRLIKYDKEGQAFRMAIPTPEHYLPLLYVLSLQQKDEQVSFFNDKAVGGSLSMTSMIIK